MLYFRHITFAKNELYDILMISSVLGVLFTFSFFLFNRDGSSFISIFLLFTLFILIMMILRMCFMKYFSASNGFEFQLRQTYFDRYGLRQYDRISEVRRRVEKKVIKAPFTILKKVTPVLQGKEYNTKGVRGEWDGIPMTLISIFIYVFSLGLIIFPSMWRYNTKIIPYLFLGTVHRKEIELDWLNPRGVTGYRYSRVLFTGFLFYILFAIIFKYTFGLIFPSIYLWMMFIIIWISLFTLIPIPGTEGHDLFFMSRFAWIMSITILVLGYTSILIFNSLTYLLFSIIISFIMVLFVYFWRKFT